MTPSCKTLTVATLTALTLAITPLAAQAAIPVYGGLGVNYTGTTPTGAGYIGASTLGAQTTYVGSAVGASAVTKIIDGASSSTSFAQRATPSGSVELGNFNASPAFSNNLSYVSSTNLQGDIVGASKRYNAAGTDLGLRAAKWSAGSTTPIELLPIATSTSGTALGAAYAVNSFGVSVGFSTQYSGDTKVADLPVKWDAAGNPTILTTLSYTTTDLAPFLPFAFGSNGAVAINDAGSAVGNIAAVGAGKRAFIWDAANNATELQSLGAAGASANSTVRILNASGTSAGVSRNASNQNRAVTWSPSGVVTPLAGPLGAFANYSSDTRDINGSGTVIGTSTFTSASDTRGVYWAPDGTPTLLSPLSLSGTGITSDSPVAINDAGVIVGNARLYTTATLFTPQAVAWKLDGSIINLNSLIDPNSGWLLSSVLGISEDNWVTGTGSFDPDGTGPIASYSRLYLLQLPESVTAIPEPTTLALLPLATLPLLRRRR